MLPKETDKHTTNTTPLWVYMSLCLIEGYFFLIMFKIRRREVASVTLLQSTNAWSMSCQCASLRVCVCVCVGVWNSLALSLCQLCNCAIIICISAAHLLFTKTYSRQFHSRDLSHYEEKKKKKLRQIGCVRKKILLVWQCSCFVNCELTQVWSDQRHWVEVGELHVLGQSLSVLLQQIGQFSRTAAWDVVLALSQSPPKDSGAGSQQHTAAPQNVLEEWKDKKWMSFNQKF